MCHALCRLHFEEHCLVAALQAQVELVDGIAAAAATFGNQRRAAIRWRQREHGIAGIGLLIAEIDPRIEMG
jgi:hypothetical protein